MTDFAESHISRVLDIQIGSADPKISDDALFLQLLLSPLRKEDGSLWPFTSKDVGLLWILDTLALFPKDNESHVPDEVNSKRIEEYLLPPGKYAVH